MTINEAVASSTDVRFSSGTIDFDIKPLAYSDTGIIFRRQGNESGEIVYLRANPDCPAANDCIQYAPIVHGHMQWDIYPNYQGPAQINPTGWNHVRLVVAGEKMAVYINHETEPTLIVPKLQGLSRNGGIAFKGPAIYANFVIRPGDPATLPAIHIPQPSPETATHWLSAPPTALAGHAPTAADIPPPGSWHAIAAEPTGLVNLGRAFDVREAHAISTGWLKTTVTAKAPTRRTVQIGYARQASVFLNGRLVYSGNNPYYPPDHRLSPDGRLETDNATILLELRQGQNEIVLAVGNSWQTSTGVIKPDPYGWGAELHFDTVSVITLQ
ncbi:hypothetical protein [Lichenicoccus sp.]|uniref:hypothetical protein n=1 Tax=Lichenicoccus sp. TaxID=2781899 RepID=UPI003D09A16A